jgi:cystinosin
MGGILSMIQIIFDSIMLHDISGMTGNMAKFLLGFVTIFFDVSIFILFYVSHCGNLYMFERV